MTSPQLAIDDDAAAIGAAAIGLDALAGPCVASDATTVATDAGSARFVSGDCVGCKDLAPRTAGLGFRVGILHPAHRSNSPSMMVAFSATGCRIVALDGRNRRV